VAQFEPRGLGLECSEQNQQRRCDAHLIQLDNAGGGPSQAASGDVAAGVFCTRWSMLS
jgi:hypothetical protein